MEPALQEGDLLLALSVPGLLGQYRPRPGDVVVLSKPSDRKDLIVKRVAATEGDWVRKADNGLQLLRQHQLWVEGDNAPLSLDSRSFGAVSAALVTARPIFRLWPLNRFGFIAREIPEGSQAYRRVPSSNEDQGPR